jgi:hypothetical protein
MNGTTLIVSSNAQFNNHYPLESPDFLEPIMWKYYKTELSANSIDELTVNNFFIKKSVNYIINNKLDYSISILKKFEIIFFNIKKDAQLKTSKDYNTIRYSTIFNKLFFLSVIFIILRNFFKKEISSEDKIFIIIFISYIPPYIVGWIYERHMIPIYLISHLYLFFYFKNRLEFKMLKLSKLDYFSKSKLLL